jgi:sugar/nucleoside kinase (ribokinase family)
MKRLSIIGGASLDRLHFSGRTAQVAGGAGLYTAAAAHQMGTAVTMYAPRPTPMPDLLRPLEDRVEWIGPDIPPEELPHFEITYNEDGKASYERATFGAEMLLDPDCLPEDLSHYGIVHLTPVGSARHQFELLQICRQRGAKRISAGTYPCKVKEELEYTQRVFEAADLFFMNEHEAEDLVGTIDEARTYPGKILFITMGRQGAMVIQGDLHTFVPAVETEVLDPTGAGDTFCGATLAGMIQGMHPLIAAGKAASLAAHMITAFGPTALWDSEPTRARDPRVALDQEQIARVAGLIGTLPEVTPFNFTGSEFPPVDHPAALDYFFAAALQQFGFWEESKGRYQRPMIAEIGGVKSKGSDYLWRAYLRELAVGEGQFYRPSQQAKMSLEDMLNLFRADDGSDPLPVVDLHLTQAHAYGKDMVALGLSPREIVDRANASEHPLQGFLEQLDHIGGYKEDPLRKKAVLLAIILAQRPERFLEFEEDHPIPPVIDYHLMRSCLRIGLVELKDEAFQAKVSNRDILKQDEEWAVRYPSYEAIQQVVELSGKSMGAVDWFFFNARRRCPEMTEPECARCPVDPVCAHRKELFQPVLRTTFY